MKAQFIVTIEGDWYYNGKPATAAKVGKQLREAAKDEFEYLAARITVKPYKSAAQASPPALNQDGGSK